MIHMHRHNKTTTEEPSSDKAEILNTSFAEMALAPSELGDKLSIDEEVVSLLCRKKGFHCEKPTFGFVCHISYLAKLDGPLRRKLVLQQKQIHTATVSM